MCSPEDSEADGKSEWAVARWCAADDDKSCAGCGGECGAILLWWEGFSGPQTAATRAQRVFKLFREAEWLQRLC